MSVKELVIAGRKIGQKHRPYLIAEMSANHNGKLERALEIIELAKSCGADAIKIQTYTADTMTIDCDQEDFQIHGGLWDGYTLYKLYEQAQTPYEWHKPMFDHAKSVGITIFSTPFDETAVNLLEELNTPAYKIASFEAIDLPLVKYVSSTGKPIIISTGMANEEEIQEAIDTAHEGGCKEVAILHCVSGYPAPAEDYNLSTIPDMIHRFGLITGLSDHTLDNTIAIASVTLGASIIEKHFTLDRSGGSPDDSFSLEPVELTKLCIGVRTAWEALGSVDYGLKSSEQGNVQFRRSLYFIKDLEAGELITTDAIRSVRPGYGLSPKHIDMVIGKRVNIKVKANMPVTNDVLVE